MNIRVRSSSLPPRAGKHRQVDYRDSDMKVIWNEACHIATLPPRAGEGGGSRKGAGPKRSSSDLYASLH